MDRDPTWTDITTDPLTLRMVGRAIHGNTPFDVPYMSQIDDNLWLGGCENGLVLPPEIENVVSLYPWESYTVLHKLHSKTEVRLYDSVDGINADVILPLAEWVNACRAQGPTLVHCQAGLNRSSLIAATALVLDGMAPQDAIDLIREKRSSACLCNPAFKAWLTDELPGLIDWSNIILR